MSDYPTVRYFGAYKDEWGDRRVWKRTYMEHAEGDYALVPIAAFADKPMWICLVDSEGDEYEPSCNGFGPVSDPALHAKCGQFELVKIAEPPAKGADNE